jgi:ATP-binding cassette subfamily B protein
MDLLINRQLTQAQIAELRSHAPDDDPILFAIIGDISDSARYTHNVLAVSSKSFFTYDLDSGKKGDVIKIAEVSEIYNKRMYGNGVMRARINGGEIRDVYRFTFAVAGLCDAAVYFVNAIHSGTDLKDAMESIDATYEKQLSICPKCGRTLSAPGVSCINCESKTKIISKLAKYMIPEKKILIFSIVLSIITTALALIPPYLTRTLVDNILVAGNKASTEIKLFGVYDMNVKNSLMIIGIMLASNYVIRFSLGAIRGYYLRKSGDRIVKSLRDDVFEHAQFLPMRFYDKTSTGSVINRISGDSANLQSFMLRITQEVVVQFFKMIGIIVVMIAMNWRLALYSLIPVPFVAIGARIFSQKIAPYYRRIWRRWSTVSGVLTDTIHGIRVIKSFTNEKNSTKYFEEKNPIIFMPAFLASLILSA